MAVRFKSEDHSYVSINPEENIKWISVTSFISKFKDKFDAISVSEKCSKNRKSKWYGITPEKIRELWSSEADRATTLGTWYHNERENELLSLNTVNQHGKDLSVHKPIIDKDGLKYAPEQKLEEGIYPEHFVYLKSAGLCGQSDRVDVVDGKIHIIDYKTNKEIKTEGFKSWDGKVKKMMEPISHLDDCNFYHYALQLSIYMYIIIKHNPKLKPGSMKLHHVIFEENGTDVHGNPQVVLDEHQNPIVKEIVVYEVPYLKQEVNTLINHLKAGK